MGGKKRKKKLDVSGNKRLDVFLTNLENEKKQLLLDHVEDITFKALKDRISPKLRLKSDK